MNGRQLLARNWGDELPRHIHYIYAKIWDASGVVAELTWQTS
ncbi:hypothetical protein OAI06_04000 [Schleiferiaceae bacterium]|jgi:hypothetical protein|nr:hypothetical protein [Schleiferiaceae bacterium]MDC3183182.1 hypothetical protein [Schleiferiaceae bacterium]